MNTTFKNEEKAKNFFEYLIAIAIVFNTRSIYLHISNNANNKFTFVVLLILIIGIFGRLYFEKNISKNMFNTGCVSVLLLALYLFVYILIRNNDFLEDAFYLVSACLIFFFYFFCCPNNSVPELIYKYKKVILVIAVYSLFMWIVCTKLNLIQPSGKLYSTWAHNEINNYYWIYFETQAQRNTSLFTEAPMSSLHFSVALAIELFLSKKTFKRNVLVLILAILTTTSVTGYVFVGIALFAKLLFYKFDKRLYNELKLIVLPIIGIAIILIGYNLVMQRMATRSGIVRLNDFINCFNVWSHNVLFGVGGGDVADELLSGSSNSLGRLLAERGLYIGILYLFCFYRAIKNSILSKNIYGFVFVMLFLYLFIITIIPYTYLTMFILIYFAKNKQNRVRCNLSVKITKANNNIKSNVVAIK